LTGRGLPGMPLEMPDPEDDGGSDFGRVRLNGRRTPWWRPSGTMGRVFLGLAALAILTGVAVAVHSLKTYLERDGRFRIAGTSDIQATGLAEVNRGDLLQVFGEDVGRNIFFVPLAERRKQLEQIPWIQRATVMRVMPDQIRVNVVERQPVAFVRHGQQIGLVDANGVLLSMPPAMMAQRHYSFPVLTGVDAGDSLASRKARIDLYLRLMSALDAGGQHLSDQISEIDLTDPEDARVIMAEQGSDILAHFGEDHFLERYQRYKAHIAEWRQQYPRLAEVDLRYAQQVVLEMSSGAAAQTTSDAGDAGTQAGKTAAAGGNAKTTTAQPHADEKSAKGQNSASGKASKARAARTRAEKLRAERIRAEKARAAKLEERKRAEAMRIALNLSWQKNAQKSHPAAAGGQGQ
jgi:cell division protein FtsQ